MINSLALPLQVERVKAALSDKTRRAVLSAGVVYEKANPLVRSQSQSAAASAHASVSMRGSSTFAMADAKMGAGRSSAEISTFRPSTIRSGGNTNPLNATSSGSPGGGMIRPHSTSYIGSSTKRTQR